MEQAQAQAETTASNEPIVIAVQNPSSEEMHALLADIKVNYDFDVDTKSATFNFKKSKDKDTGIETVRNAVELAIPYPSVQGIVSILEGGGKGLDLLIDAIEGIINGQARDLLYADTTLNAATFPVDKVSWEHIANLPKAQRRGGGIPKETWEAFAQDYVAVIPTAAGKTVEQAAAAAKLLVGRLAAVKTNEPVLMLLTEQLAIYSEATTNLEEFAEVVDFLVSKAETFMNLSEEELLANL